MMQTAEGAMDEMTNIVQRMKDLATQAANGTSSDKDIAAMNAEFGELTKELKNIASNTTFGGENLLDSKNGKFAKGEVTFQIGNTSSETLALDVKDVLGKVVGSAAGKTTAQANLKPVKDYQDEAEATSGAGKLKAAKDKFAAAEATYKALTGKPTTGEQKAYDDAVEAMSVAQKAYDDGLKPLVKDAMTAGNGLDANVLEIGLTQTSAQFAMGKMEEFMQDITSVRSSLGANINRLEHTVNNLSNMKENTDIAKGRIMDADFATESTNMTKNQMLTQAGMSVLGKSNEMTGMVTIRAATCVAASFLPLAG